MQKILASVLFFLNVFVVYAEEPKLTFAFSEHELFPYQMGKGIYFPKENPGIYIEAVRFIEKQVPIKVVIKRIPTKRIWTELEYGTVSSTGASYKPSRKKFAIYPYKTDGEIDPNKSLLTGSYALYVLKKSSVGYNPKTNRFINISYKKGIVAEIGFSIVDDLRKSGNLIEENAAGNYAMLQQLSLKRIDGIVAHVQIIDDILKKYPQEFKSISMAEPIIKTKNYYFVISHQFYKKYPKISKQVWERSAEFRQKRLQKLQYKYRSLRKNEN
ncbi:MAG: amino acid ABC transporter substrate-binding protein [Desulfobacterales bacterium]|nr:amino acid ABC transporter substrate-binding protein [Desulfobacterales bacterium]MCP4158592.1 amino acid ABC transporter substrate-binding protein [Deltaproteobacteria bacterium]